jgi:hypothetical protein
MSTRSVIRIKGDGKKVDLYHHYDGYIEGVGFDLLDMFYKNGELKFGFIENVVNNLIKKENDCYEWTPYKHGDIEYFYTIDVDKNELTAKEVDNWGDRMKTLKKWNTNQLIELYKVNRGL